MSKTFKMNVSFPMTIVVNTESVKDFTEARDEARKILETGKALKGETKFRVELMASGKSDDEVMQTIYRSGIREVLRKDFVKEICGAESSGRIGDTKVVFEAPMVTRTCDRCIVTECPATYKRDLNVGCSAKQTGVRELVNTPIPQSFGERIVSGWDAGDV